MSCKGCCEKCGVFSSAQMFETLPVSGACSVREAGGGGGGYCNTPMEGRESIVSHRERGGGGGGTVTPRWRGGRVL